MSNKILEKCPYCTTDILYTGAETLVKCLGCGQTLMVAKFQSEQLKLRQAQQQNEAARMALAAAQQEKEESQQRLNAALMELGAIQSNQLDEKEALRSLAEGQQASGETLASMQALLQGLRMGQGAQQDGLSSVLSAVLTSGDSAEQKLANLQTLTQKVLQAQNETGSALYQALADVSQMLERLRLDGAETSQAVQKFSAWFVSPARQEDTRRLQSVEEASRQLLRGQADISEKIAGLQKEAEQTRAAIQSFENKWEQSKLQELSALYHQAQDAQRERRFDQAAGTYRMVIQKGGPDSEVYWRLVLCHYCVEYQWDDKGQFIPTLLYPDLTPAGQLSVRRDLEGSLNTSEERQYYGEKLRQIDGILEKYRKIQHRVRCDVFISVKQNQHGGYTSDSDIASDLYDYIAGLGLSVFNSRRTPIPAGEEFEPYIIAALMSARVLMVVGTSGENMQSQWVRNEWLRFQWLQRHQQDKQNRRTLFCYLANGMRPEDIPGELNPNVQAIISGIQAQERLRATLQHALPEHFQAMPAPAAPREPAAQESLEHIQDQMLVWLYTERFDLVTNKYKSLVEGGKHLTEARLHLYALCAKHQLSDLGYLARQPMDLAAEMLFKLARKMAKKPEDQALLDDLLRQNHQAMQSKAKRENAGAARKTHTLENGDVYEGELVNGVFSGQGKLTGKNGDVYTGLFENGLFNGQGKYVWSNGDTYTGEFRDGHANGQGRRDYINGDVYEGAWQEGQRNGPGGLVWKDGSVYTGDWIRDQRTGQGKYTHTNGGVYEGQFRNGKFHGQGRYTWPNDEVYTGDWKDSKEHGQGKRTYLNGEVYEGTWQGGSRAQGKLTYPDGSVYQGTFEKEVFSGQGKFTEANGNVYEGAWKAGKHDGLGRYEWKNGAVYFGDWMDGRCTGMGKHTLPNGDVYEGRFQDGKYHGQGMLKRADGQVAEGEWKDGRLTRQETRQESGTVKKPASPPVTRQESGTVKKPAPQPVTGQESGTVKKPAPHSVPPETRNNEGKKRKRGVWLVLLLLIAGAFYLTTLKDKPAQPPSIRPSSATPGKTQTARPTQARATPGKTQTIRPTQAQTTPPVNQVTVERIVYSNGNIYEGEVQNGRYNGQGKYTWASGTVYEGAFKDGQFNGQGKMTFVDGEVYLGAFKDDQRHGFGKYTWPEGGSYEGYWKDGLRDGQGKTIYPNGNIHEGQWKAGKREGDGKLTYNDGAIYEGGFVNDVRSGTGIIFFANGNIFDGEWKDDEFFKGEYVYADGGIYFGPFKDFLPEGRGEYTAPNGNVYEGQFARGDFNGQGKMTYKNGDVFEGEWKNGLQNGQGKYTFADGTVRTGTWVEGVLQR